MSQLVPSLIAAAQMTIRRRRELAVAGKALVQIGDLVEANAPVVRGEIPGDIVVVSPSEVLGVPYDAALRAAYRVKEGDAVQAGDILVHQTHLWGLVSSTVTAPIGGSVSFITHEHGRIGIQYPARVVERRAFLGGRVVQIDPDGAVELENQVTFVQGIFGVGGERSGKLLCLTPKNTSVLQASDIPDEGSGICSGAVLVAAGSPTSAAIACAAARGAVGIICGSIGAGTLKQFVGVDLGVAVTGDEAISLTLIVTEGFGSIRMSERTWTLLSQRNGGSVSINGATQVRAGAVRPEIIIPWDSSASERSKETSIEPSRELRLAVGSAVRLIRFPYFGLLGTVAALPDALTELETGARVRVAQVALADGRCVVVPRANIELI